MSVLELNKTKRSHAKVIAKVLSCLLLLCSSNPLTPTSSMVSADIALTPLTEQAAPNAGYEIGERKWNLVRPAGEALSDEEFFLGEALSPSSVITVAPSASRTLGHINIPGDPTMTHAAPASAKAEVSISDRGGIFEYETRKAGWAGCGFTYDDVSTPAKETRDLSQMTDLVVGLQGSAPVVKLEVVDIFGHKSFVELTEIRADQEQVWAVQTVLFTSEGVDLTKVTGLNFIVEGSYLTGTLTINDKPLGAPAPLPNPFFVSPDHSRTRADTNVPGSPIVFSSAAPEALAVVKSTERGEIFTFETSLGGWASGGFTYDTFSTPEKEFIDLSHLNELVVGLKGASVQVKFEITDKDDHKSFVYLTGIQSDREQVWSIPLAGFPLAGVDLSTVVFLNFVVEGRNLNGSLEINNTPGAIPESHREDFRVNGTLDRSIDWVYNAQGVLVSKDDYRYTYGLRVSRNFRTYAMNGTVTRVLAQTYWPNGAGLRLSKDSLYEKGVRTSYESVTLNSSGVVTLTRNQTYDSQTGKLKTSERVNYVNGFPSERSVNEYAENGTKVKYLKMSYYPNGLKIKNSDEYQYAASGKPKRWYVRSFSAEGKPTRFIERTYHENGLRVAQTKDYDFLKKSYCQTTASPEGVQISNACTAIKRIP